MIKTFFLQSSTDVLSKDGFIWLNILHTPTGFSTWSWLVRPQNWFHITKCKIQIRMKNVQLQDLFLVNLFSALKSIILLLQLTNKINGWIRKPYTVKIHSCVETWKCNFIIPIICILSWHVCIMSTGATKLKGEWGRGSGHGDTGLRSWKT